jgi:hypothetical protein
VQWKRGLGPLVIFISVLITPVFCAAKDAGWDVAGVRAGSDLTDGHSSSTNFALYEVFAAYRLPFEVGGGSAPTLRARLNGSAGALTRKEATGAIGSFGPSLVMGAFSDRLEIDGGGAVALISRHDFPARNLGGPVQFVLHAEMSIYVIRSIGIGYRFEHISNASLYERNPGVNFHILELKYRF